MKPTIIGMAGPKKVVPAPTVIPTSIPACAPSAIPKEQLKAPEAPQKVPVPHAASGPTAIGTPRKRVSATVEELEQRSPGVKPAVIAHALSLIRSSSGEDTEERTAILWGHEAQVSYGKLVTESLSLSQAEAVSHTNTNVSRLLTILESIDLKAVCGLGEKPGFLARLGRKSGKIDTAESLKKARGEIDKILRLLQQRFDELLDLKTKLENISDSIDKVGDEVEALAIAASFLADHIGKTAPDSGLKQCFSQRSMSLTQTLAQIRTSGSAREIQIEQPLRLVNVVQQVALVSVPGLLSSIVSIGAMAEERRGQPTVTDVDEVGSQIQDVIENLKPKP